ncbi:hypothetical protein T07_5730 [Trichinella nelsoni]|uniref:Uncharacterized protein n=1 Tax=Trichinella nelsoni TaxID=6336 RepID=A0A0V0SAH0_9BILA|nr:hypothetical protein T07_5730 [Trichinella nelsoni]
MIMRYSLKFPSLVQYFFVLGNSIFLHFRSVSNKLKKVVSLWFQRRFWKVLRHINSCQVPILIHRKPPYWNSVGMEQGWLNFRKAELVAIIMRYSFAFCSIVQYFVVLGNLIFLHFLSISNKFKKVVYYGERCA